MAQTSSKKGIFPAVVTANRRIGECFWVMHLEFTGEGARAFARFEAGQFLQLDVSDVALPPLESIPVHLMDGARRSVLLRRPFSFADVTVKGDVTTAELLYCVVGPASLRMTTLGQGETVSIIGPLGNGFWVPADKKTALLVVGGMGLPPIACLAKSLTAEHPDIDAVAFVGARSAHAMPIEGLLDEISAELGHSVPVFAQYGIPSLVATDDGSLGHSGLVTEKLAHWLEGKGGADREESIIYACGPEPMLAAVAKIARDHKVDCQVSMERRMACGIGLCQSCAVEFRVDGSDETIYRLCCKDGPVFEAKDVVFAP